MAIDERELDDADLVWAAQEGDTEAFAELFRRHYPAVKRICARRLGNLAEADEVAQAAFVRAYERIDQCGGERRFGAWVQVIAYRVGADARRLQARALPTDEPVTGDAALGPNSCEDALLRSEQVAEVRDMLATLPPRQREVIIARDLEGRRPGEIAASLGLSLGAVDSLLLRARRRMASAWQAATVEHGAASLQVTTASLAATTIARGEGIVTGAVRAVGSAFNRASLHIANALGLMPGTPSVAHTLSRLALSGAALVPVAGAVASRHAPATVPGAAVPAGLQSVAVPSLTVPAHLLSVDASSLTASTAALTHLSQVRIPPIPATAATPLPGATSPPGVVAGGQVGQVGQVVAGAANSVGATVAGVTATAGQAVSGVAPAAGAAVQAVGSAVGSAVGAAGTAATHTVAGVVGSLTTHR